MEKLKQSLSSIGISNAVINRHRLVLSKICELFGDDFSVWTVRIGQTLPVRISYPNISFLVYERHLVIDIEFEIKAKVNSVDIIQKTYDLRKTVYEL